MSLADWRDWFIIVFSGTVTLVTLLIAVLSVLLYRKISALAGLASRTLGPLADIMNMVKEIPRNWSTIRDIFK